MRKRDFFQRSQQKKYEERTYRNPYFRADTSTAFSRSLWIALAICGVISAISAFFFLHPFFNITRVHIVGVKHLDRVQLVQAIHRDLRKNRFLFDPGAFATKLNSTFAFRDLQIVQQGRLVEMRLVERTSQLIWKTGSQTAVVDLEGVVIRLLDAADELEHLSAILPLFVDRNAVSVAVGDIVLTREETEAVFRFHEHLGAQSITFVQTEFDRLAGKWIGVVTSDGYRILFDASTDVDLQAARLETVLREKSPDRSKLEYIDLRFGDHVYFK
ncbi:hypothetical protein FJZ23_00210 [Candidatus Parcubacteria bacterium]|nr:hypothetical protein [Candidatus Parcubacteria bacterium]